MPMPGQKIDSQAFKSPHLSENILLHLEKKILVQRFPTQAALMLLQLPEQFLKLTSVPIHAYDFS